MAKPVLGKLVRELLDYDEVLSGLRGVGVSQDDSIIVHSSMSSLGHLDGGATSVLAALLTAVGRAGTVIVPAFTGSAIRDPHPGVAGPPGEEIAAARDRIQIFDDRTPTDMGALPSAVLAHPDRVRSAHPQASVAAIGFHAHDITDHQPLSYALGAESPFQVLYDLGAKILLIGVGHNRNSFLHHAESRTEHHRHKIRRFPYLVDGQRVWVEVPDVADDNNTYFPSVGEDFDARGSTSTATIGSARCRLISAQPFVDYAIDRFDAIFGAR